MATAAYGDFQTPPELAGRVCRFLAGRGLAPASVVEPTCGLGHFLFAALDAFPSVQTALAGEINPEYLDRLAATIRTRADADKIRVLPGSFFDLDWPGRLANLPEPILVVGNPPWVTNAGMSTVSGTNLPVKTNAARLRGLDARTGKSNFDISEWMLARLLEGLDGRRATLAMLCKTAVARKVLAHVWKSERRLTEAEIRPIDAAASFGAAVDAGLLVCSLDPAGACRDARTFAHLEDDAPTGRIGFRDGTLLADVAAHDRWRHLEGKSEQFRWRSGIKHDCARVMELRPEGDDHFRNGLGELVRLEPEHLYPMRKSTELAHGCCQPPVRWMLVPQRTMGEDTAAIREHAPMTWDYLQRHGEALDRRASSIYRSRPRFAVFGVGGYTFAPWKVAVSGLSKTLRFTVVEPHAGRPTVLDDTSYFVAGRDRIEARSVASLLNSPTAHAFYSAYVFWDAKRPITAEILGRLDISTLARVSGCGTVSASPQEGEVPEAVAE